MYAQKLVAGQPAGPTHEI